MKFLAFILSLSLVHFSAAAEEIGSELQPSARLSFLPDNVALGTSDGTWCTVSLTSPSNSVSGLGSYVYTQVNSQGVMREAPLVGAVQIFRAYKFLLKDDELTVEIRDVDSGRLLCSLSGNGKRVEAQGIWVWPTATPFEGADFCKSTKPRADQQIEKANLQITCSK